MTRRELQEHLSYWSDPVKRSAYELAFDELVEPGATVLDLGSGTGLLGLLALRAGAARVVAVERGDIIGPARKIAAHNGVGDRIDFVRGRSVDVDLPPVDVVVCDQIGGFVHDAGVLRFFADAEARALRPGGHLIPGSFEFFLAPVRCDRGRRAVDGWLDPVGFDLSDMWDLAVNTTQRVRPKDIELLAPGSQVAACGAASLDPIIGHATFERCVGAMDGFVGWFRARLSPSSTLTNDPLDPRRMARWVNFYPLRRRVEIAEETQVECHIDVRPADELVIWQVEVDQVSQGRQSSFHGRFLSSESLGFGPR